MKSKGVLILSGLLILATSLSAQKWWIETTQEDFADGDFSPALYAADTGVAVDGAVEMIQVRDIDKDGNYDLVISNNRKGTLAAPDSAHYSYHFENGSLVDSLFSWNSSGNLVADYNNDGYPDVILSSYDNQAGQTGIWTHIYYGPNFNSKDSILTGYHAMGISTADLDIDGYLDLVISNLEGRAVIKYGGPDGILDSLACSRCYANAVADLDKDGDLDIVLAGANGLIFNGPDYSSPLTVPGIDSLTDVSIADIDEDENLDLVFSAFGDTSYVVFGPSFTSREKIPTINARGVSVADLNEDDNLDIVFSNFADSTGLDTKSYVYFGPISGTNIPTQVSTYRSIGNMIADFDVDGEFEVCFTNNMTPDSASYEAYSYIYETSDFMTYDSVPSNGAHMSTTMDLGNVYTRSNVEYYISSVFDAERVADWDSVLYTAVAPAGSQFKFFVQTGDTLDPDSTWSDWLERVTRDTLPDSMASRYIRYRVMLGTNYLQAPRLDEVRISYPALSDVAPDSLVSPDPEGITDCGTQLILVRVKNFSEDSLVFPVHCILDSLGTNVFDSIINLTLQANDSQLVSFGSVYICPSESLWIITELAEDVNNSNDTLFCVMGSSSVSEKPENAITTLTLSKSGGVVSIAYSLPENDKVCLSVYDASGRLVALLDSGKKTKGQHVINWNASSDTGTRVSSGVYFVRLETASSMMSRKVVLVD